MRLLPSSATWPPGTCCSSGSGRTTLLDWAAVLAVTLALAAVLELLSVPSAPLFAGLVAGLGRALLGRRRLVLPRSPMTGAQASYLTTLTEEAHGEPPADDLTKAEASKQIDALKDKLGR